MFSFETPPIDLSARIALPDYSLAPEVACAYLSVLYGKRFDNHGLVQSTGSFQLPDLSHFSTFCLPGVAFNSHQERSDIRVPLNLNEISRFESFFTDARTSDEAAQSGFLTASRFYAQSLREAETSPEMAYLNLITAGEVLSEYVEIPEDDLLDEDLRTHLERLNDLGPKGLQVAGFVKSRTRQVKRRFVHAILQLVDQGYYAPNEADAKLPVITPGDIERRVGAAYDLRSRFLHAGASFGGWITPFRGPQLEVQIGEPVVDDKNLKRALAWAPTFVGLERMIRYCLLKFAELQGFYSTPVPEEDA